MQWTSKKTVDIVQFELSFPAQFDHQGSADNFSQLSQLQTSAWASSLITVSSICINLGCVCGVQVTTCSLKRQMRPICSARSLKQQRILPTLDRHLHVQAFRLYTYLLAIFGLRSHSGRSAKRIRQGFSTTGSWCSNLRGLFLSWNTAFGSCKSQKAMFLLVWKTFYLLAICLVCLRQRLLKKETPNYLRKQHNNEGIDSCTLATKSLQCWSVST